MGASEPTLLFPVLVRAAQYRVTNEQGLAGRTGDGSVGVALNWPIWMAASGWPSAASAWP